MNALKSLFSQSKKPQYWLDYQSKFQDDERKELTFDNTHFVVFDCESTGLDTRIDRIISVGAVSIEQQEILVKTSFEQYVKQDYFNSNSVEIHGILKDDQRATIVEQQLIEQWLPYIGNSVLVAHHAWFDIELFNQLLHRKDLPKLKNKVLDTEKLYLATQIKSAVSQGVNSSLDAIAEDYQLDVSDRHTAAGDAFLTALIFLETTTKLRQKGISLSQMLKKYGL